jgi:hypothetical protein
MEEPAIQMEQPAIQMEEPAVLHLNLRYYTQLLEIETDLEKRIAIMALMDEIKTDLMRQHVASASGLPDSDR